MWERTLSQKLVRLFCEQKVVDESKADAYVYGYELLISSVVSVLLVVLIAVVCGDVRYALSFLIGFIPQRIYIGGYHATSHTRCYLAFTGLALICILLSKVIAANHLFRILTTAALMGIAIFFSPIEATNKPLGKKKRLSYKMVASVLSSIDFLFAIFNVLPDTRSITVYYISKWVLVIFAIIPFNCQNISRRDRGGNIRRMQTRRRYSAPRALHVLQRDYACHRNSLSRRPRRGGGLAARCLCQRADKLPQVLIQR